MARIELKTEINAEKELVFDLARSLDLHMLSTSQTDERIVGGKLGGLLELGESVTWRAKHFGIYQNLEAKITALEYPYFFKDEMVSGVFKEFQHEHTFKQTDYGTEMLDVFTFVSPMGAIGKLADSLIIKRYLTEFLQSRNQVIKKYAESELWKTVLKKKI